MKRLLMILFLALASSSVLAWNGAGHRLVAAVAWRQMSEPTRQQVHDLLARHPDYPRWVAKAGENPGYTAFLEAATWADDIRKDSRFYDDGSEGPTRKFPGMPDTARHRDWHYVDRLADGQRRAGELDRQLAMLIQRLGDPKTPAAEKTYALPWLIHLVGDVHQPLHVGSRDDEGGNRFEIENPLNPRLPFTNLHTWWDDLPGPPWLRGERLEKAADALARTSPPSQGGPEQWEKESRRLSEGIVYPSTRGNGPPTITAEFLEQSRAIANQRLSAAGWRLGRLLEALFNPVPRETPARR